MRLMFLTNVAVAALAALCFQAGAQDSGPKLDKALPAAESVAPSSNEPRRVIQGGHHVTSTQGEVQTPSTATRQGMKGGRSATAGQGKVQTSAKVVKLNERQQAELRSEPVEKLDRVDFSLSTGTSVPSYAPIRPLPERIVEIVPQYRDYDFVMVRDEIVIIEPRTRQIVTVSPGEGRSAAYAPRGRLRLTSEQRQVIRRDLAPEGSAIHTQVQLGERVPADVSLLPMPAAVLSDVPIVGSFLYFVTDEDVVLVAPDTREVVELIPKLDASGGMIKPPPGVDPQIVKPAPVPEPNSTPVIPPPGMPGGPPGPEPK